MKALILSCETGGGYTDISVAVKEKLEDHGHEVTLFDLHSQKGDSSGGFLRRRSGAQTESDNELMVQQYLEENSFDVIIATHVVSAVLLSVLRGSLVPFPNVIHVASDYTCVPFIEDTLCDYYVIPSQKLTAEYCRRGILREKIFPLGIPVRTPFLTGISRDEARAKCGLVENAYHILLAAEGLSGRRVRRTVKLLQTYLGQNPKARLIIFGMRKGLYERLNAKYKNDERITLWWELPEPAMYMRACDVMISNAYGLSSTEAAVLGTALIQYAPATGCERHNAEFFTRYGMSIAVRRPGTGLLQALRMLEDAAVREDMIKAQHFHISQLAAVEIADIAEMAATSVDTDQAGALT